MSTIKLKKKDWESFEQTLKRITNQRDLWKETATVYMEVAEKLASEKDEEVLTSFVPEIHHPEKQSVDTDPQKISSILVRARELHKRFC